VAKGLTTVQQQWRPRLQSVVPVLPPRLAVIEICALLVVPALLEWLLPAFPDLTTFHPHPYWAAILILSLQYGTVSGLLAAAVAIVATVVIGLPEPDIGENHFAYLIRAWTQPVLWISAALLLGHFRMRQIEQRNELNRAVEELQYRSDALTNHVTELKVHCGKLERRLATRPKSGAPVLLDIMSRAHAATATELTYLFDSAIQSALPGTRATLYRLHGDVCAPIAVSPPQSNPTVAPKASPNVMLLQSMRNNVPLSVLSGQDDHALGTDGIFAVPVASGSMPGGNETDNVSIIGALVVEAMPPAFIEPRTLERLQMLSNMFSPAVSVNRPVPTAADPSAQPQRADTVVAIPHIQRWRQIRWLPRALRATVEPPAGGADNIDNMTPRTKSSIGVSR
jgi:hypothetical protein